LLLGRKKKQLKNLTQLTAVYFMILGLIFPHKYFMVLCGQQHISAVVRNKPERNILLVAAEE